MTPEQKAAYIQSQATSAMIEALGMQALNKERELRGESMAYDDVAFDKLIEKYGLDHNTVVKFLKN